MRAFKQHHVESFWFPAQQFLEDARLPAMAPQIACVKEAPALRFDGCLSIPTGLKNVASLRIREADSPMYTGTDTPTLRSRPQ
jgi:hypothetical protein